MDKIEKTKTFLRELGSIGASKAANALSDMIMQDISIEVPGIHMVSPIEIPEVLQFHDLQTVVIIEQLSQNLECDLILVFTIDEAKKLVRLLMETVGMEGIDEFEVLDEIGNILLGNFINAFSDFTEITLKPTPPTHLVDYFEAILNNYVTKLMYQEKQATLFDTSLKCGETDIKGLILMFLSDEFQNSIICRMETRILDSIQVKSIDVSSF